MLHKTRYVLLGVFVAVLGLWGLAVTIPNTFSSGEVVSSSKMNQNFQALRDAVNTLEAKVAALEAKAPATKSGTLAYALVLRDGTLVEPYYFNPAGDIVTTRLESGKYEVDFQGLDLSGAGVLVSTYWGPDDADKDNLCHVDRYLNSTVYVSCVDTDSADGQDSGTLGDMSFTVLVIK